MATQSLNFNQTASFEVAQTPSPFARLIKWINQEMSARRTASQLQQLSDDELNDIGLTRFQIEAAARHRFGF